MIGQTVQASSSKTDNPLPFPFLLYQGPHSAAICSMSVQNRRLLRQQADCFGHLILEAPSGLKRIASRPLLLMKAWQLGSQNLDPACLFHNQNQVGAATPSRLSAIWVATWIHRLRLIGRWAI